MSFDDWDKLIHDDRFREFLRNEARHEGYPKDRNRSTQNPTNTSFFGEISRRPNC